MGSEKLGVFATIVNIGWLDNGLDLFEGHFCRTIS